MGKNYTSEKPRRVKFIIRLNLLDACSRPSVTLFPDLSTASTGPGYSQAVSSPYSAQGRLLQQSYHGSPLIQSKPAKRSATPEHVLAEAGVEMRQLGRVGGGGGGVNTVVSSPGRQSLQSQYHGASQGPPGPLYSQASRGLTPSTTYNPGYQVKYFHSGEIFS